MTYRRFSAASRFPAAALLAAFAWTACAPTDPEASTEPTATAEGEEAPEAVVDVLATDFAFTAPPEFPSGWVTLRFENQGAEPHFLLLWRLPEGKSFGDWTSEVTQPFNALYAEYRAGVMDQGEFLERLGAALPPWFFEAERMGGAGFTSPGRTSQATMHLTPGEYAMECYVRTRDEGDTFHGKHGMLRPLIVTERATGQEPPKADLEITLTNYEMKVEGEASVGEQTVKVRVEQDPEGMILHNVHLARLGDGVSAEDAANWLDWVDSMLPPAPVEFLGGAEQVTAGNEVYFTVDLEPGRYAWVSENWGRRGMLREFTVE